MNIPAWHLYSGQNTFARKFSNLRETELGKVKSNSMEQEEQHGILANYLSSGCHSGVGTTQVQFWHMDNSDLGADVASPLFSAI